VKVSLDIMQSKPGIYVLAGSRGMAFVEVIAGGKVFNVNLNTFERDQELTGGRWLIEDMNIFGPFYTTPQLPKGTT